ncbi:hypothetical protein [Hydrogenophaga sp.]|uniref:hypothetical protein n=1 Tax=Hydrogenophaga sp. TaxID=1904254 RepID=UPI002732D40C|nr:hypothetical protein [Hydrogenophaga sp.]MDP3109017.1 hypothetical protein [Hydrogenophaga sp.]MDP3351574.1 hypothetical protein [Hydrogenophaga sp.]
MSQQFSSTINVLKVENEERTSKRTGNAYNHFAARVILLTDEGEVETVGVINSRRITPELRDSMKVGTFRATFALKVPDFGDDKGDVICMLTGLVPVQPAKVQPAPASTPPATAKA